MKIDRLTPTPAMLTELGQRLARTRKRQGLTQPELARAAGIGVATLRRIEGGNDSQFETWLKLFMALGRVATIDALLPDAASSPMEEVLAGKKRRFTPANSGPPAWGDEAE